MVTKTSPVYSIRFVELSRIGLDFLTVRLVRISLVESDEYSTNIRMFLIGFLGGILG